MMVEPPGCSAQSKSAAVGMFPSWWSSGRDLIKSWKAGDTAAEAIAGTRGERTTFQPMIISELYHVLSILLPNGSTSNPRSSSESASISCFQPSSS